MAHGDNVRIIYDQGFNGGRIMALITAVGATELTTTTGLIDASILTNAATDPRLSVEKISWNSRTAAGYFSVLFDASTDVTAFSLSGNGHWGKSFTAAFKADAHAAADHFLGGREEVGREESDGGNEGVKVTVTYK